MPFKVSDEFRKLMLLEDFKDNHPKYEVFVALASAKFFKKSIEEVDGDFLEFTGIRSFLIPLNQKKMAQGRFSYESFHGSDTYFEEDGTYITGETFEKDGVNFEIIANKRHFEGLNISYFEPTDRLVKYLKLHRNTGQANFCPGFVLEEEFFARPLFLQQGSQTSSPWHGSSIFTMKSTMGSGVKNCLNCLFKVLLINFLVCEPFDIIRHFRQIEFADFFDDLF